MKGRETKMRNVVKMITIIMTTLWMSMSSVLVYAAEPEDVLSTEAIHAEINRIRRQNGLSEVTLVTTGDLKTAADIRASEMPANFSHTRPDGTEWYTVAENAVYGENLGKSRPGQTMTSELLVEAWMESPLHKEVMLDSGYDQISISICRTKDTVYVVSEYGYSYI